MIITKNKILFSFNKFTTINSINIIEFPNYFKEFFEK